MYLLFVVRLVEDSSPVHLFHFTHRYPACVDDRDREGPLKLLPPVDGTCLWEVDETSVGYFRHVFQVYGEPPGKEEYLSGELS